MHQIAYRYREKKISYMDNSMSLRMRTLVNINGLLEGVAYE